MVNRFCMRLLCIERYSLVEGATLYFFILSYTSLTIYYTMIFKNLYIFFGRFYSCFMFLGIVCRSVFGCIFIFFHLMIQKLKFKFISLKIFFLFFSFFLIRCVLLLEIFQAYQQFLLVCIFLYIIVEYIYFFPF